MLSPLPSPTPLGVWRIGQAVLWGGLVSALALALAVATVAPEWALLVPLAALAPVALVYVARRPEVGLAVLTGLFIFASGNAPGVSLPEMLFGAFYIPYLLGWYGLRLLGYGEPIIQQRGDLAAVLFLALTGMGAVLGLLSGMRLSLGISELASFSLLAFYFPVREFCVRHPNGVTWVLGLIVAAGLIAVGRNLFNFTAIVAAAIDLRGVASGRVANHEVIIFISTVAAGTGALFLRGWALRSLGFLCFLVCFVGLVLTQFRAYYLGLALALGITFLLLDGPRRRQLASAVVLALLGLLAVASLLVGDLLMVLVGGLVERVLTIGSATSDDISLLNRFLEYERAWELIRQNPIVGYGLGVEFGFYDAIFKATWVKSYIHNAYLHLWYKLGVVGLGVFLYLCVLAAVRGLRAYRQAADELDRAAGLFLVAMLSGLGLAGLVTVLFNTDTTFPLAMAFAVGAALERRTPPVARSPAQRG